MYDLPLPHSLEVGHNYFIGLVYYGNKNNFFKTTFEIGHQALALYSIDAGEIKRHQVIGFRPNQKTGFEVSDLFFDSIPGCLGNDEPVEKNTPSIDLRTSFQFNSDELFEYFDLLKKQAHTKQASALDEAVDKLKEQKNENKIQNLVEKLRKKAFHREKDFMKIKEKIALHNKDLAHKFYHQRDYSRATKNLQSYTELYPVSLKQLHDLSNRLQQKKYRAHYALTPRVENAENCHTFATGEYLHLTGRDYRHKLFLPRRTKKMYPTEDLDQAIDEKICYMPEKYPEQTVEMMQPEEKVNYAHNMIFHLFRDLVMSIKEHAHNPEEKNLSKDIHYDYLMQVDRYHQEKNLRESSTPFLSKSEKQVFFLNALEELLSKKGQVLSVFENSRKWFNQKENVALLFSQTQKEFEPHKKTLSNHLKI